MSGYKDYAGQMNKINKDAESSLISSGARSIDVNEQAKIAARLKKERGVSLSGSIKKRYNS